MHICMSLTSIAARQRQSPALVVLLQAQEVRCAKLGTIQRGHFASRYAYNAPGLVCVQTEA